MYDIVWVCGNPIYYVPCQVIGWPSSITSKKLFLSPTPGTPDLRHSKSAQPDNPDATLPSLVIHATSEKHHSSPIGTCTYSENSHLEYTPNYTGGYVLPDVSKEPFQFPQAKDSLLVLPLPGNNSFHSYLQGILSTFRPTRDMMLNRAELQVAAYVFHPEMAHWWDLKWFKCWNKSRFDIWICLHSEVIMRMGKEKVTREEFNCFWEGNVISSEVKVSVYCVCSVWL